MKRIFGLVSALAVGLAVTSVARADDGNELSVYYVGSAAELIAFGDACTEAGAAGVPEKEAKRIYAYMKKAGAGEAEVEEWRSNAIAQSGPKMKKALAAESASAVKYACAEGIKKRIAQVRSYE